MRHAGRVAWAATLGSFIAVALLGIYWPAFPKSVFVAVGILYALFIAAGTFWMIFDALRYEERPWIFVLGAVTIVFLFVWYYLDRVRWREDADRVPVALRRRHSP